MVVDSMSIEQLADELVSDYDNEIIFRTFAIDDDKKYRKAILKSSKQGLISFKPLSYTSKNGNEFIITPFVQSRSLYKKSNEVQSSTFSRFRYRKTPFVAHYTTNVDTFKTMIYLSPSHLFQRYGERFLEENFDMTTENLSSFYITNRMVVTSALEHWKYKNHLFATINDGILLGEKIKENVFFFKTYITYDMLKGKQIDDSNEMRPIIESTLKEQEADMKLFAKLLGDA